MVLFCKDCGCIISQGVYCVVCVELDANDMYRTLAEMSKRAGRFFLLGYDDLDLAVQVAKDESRLIDYVKAVNALMSEESSGEDALSYGYAQGYNECLTHIAGVVL